MPKVRPWVRSFVGSSDDEDDVEEGLDQFSLQDLRLEAKNLRTKIDVQTQEMEATESRFRSYLQQAVDAPATKEDLYKQEARLEKEDYEQQEAARENLMTEYVALKSLVNAKKRMNRSQQSSLQDLSQEDISQIQNDISTELNELGLKNQQIDKLSQTVSHTLKAAGSTTVSPDQTDEIDDIVETASSSDELADVSVAELGESSNEETEKDDLSDLV